MAATNLAEASEAATPTTMPGAARRKVSKRTARRPRAAAPRAIRMAMACVSRVKE